MKWALVWYLMALVASVAYFLTGSIFLVLLALLYITLGNHAETTYNLELLQREMAEILRNIH